MQSKIRFRYQNILSHNAVIFKLISFFSVERNVLSDLSVKTVENRI